MIYFIMFECAVLFAYFFEYARLTFFALNPIISCANISVWFLLSKEFEIKSDRAVTEWVEMRGRQNEDRRETDDV